MTMDTPQYPIAPAPDFVQQWVKALNSGKYQQGTSVLCDPDGKHCCLGVLMELAPDDVVVRTEEVEVDYHSSMPGYVYVAPDQTREDEDEDQSIGLPDEFVMRTLGFGQTQNPSVDLMLVPQPLRDELLALLRSADVDLDNEYEEDCGTRLMTNLAGLNDNGATFAQIAEVIRYNFLPQEAHDTAPTQ